jgi:hypothetical protein
VKLEGKEMTTGFQCVALLFLSLEEGPLVVTDDISHQRVAETDPVNTEYGRNSIQNIGSHRRGGERNPRLILDGGKLGFAAKLQSDLFDCGRFCQVEDDMSREKSGSHLGSIALEGEDIRVDDEVDTSVSVLLAIRVMGLVSNALEDVMQG